MDPRERYVDPQEALRAALDGNQTGIWTALPGVVQSFDPNAVTATVQPAIQGQTRNQAGAVSNVNLPLLVDVPVVFPRGGGFTLTFPVKPGDECLVVFASRCIDGWWQGGGVKPALDKRMHDLSDGFAFVGPQSQARKIGAINTTAAELRSDDGQTVITLATEAVRVRANSITLDARQVTTTGNLAAGTGASGTFTSPTGQVVTVADGIIININ